MKVYGWSGTRREAAGKNHNGQTREIVAAPSMAAVGRIVGAKPRELWNLCETRNVAEVAAASAQPGVVLWRSSGDRDGKWRV